MLKRIHLSFVIPDRVDHLLDSLLLWLLPLLFLPFSISLFALFQFNLPKSWLGSICIFLNRAFLSDLTFGFLGCLKIWLWNFLNAWQHMWRSVVFKRWVLDIWVLELIWVDETQRFPLLGRVVLTHTLEVRGKKVHVFLCFYIRSIIAVLLRLRHININQRNWARVQFIESCNCLIY